MLHFLVITTSKRCMSRVHALCRLGATHQGLDPPVFALLVKAIVFLRLFYGVSAWGGISHFGKHLRSLDRVLRIATLVTFGLLHTTSTMKAIAVCRWLPADLAIWYELVRFVRCANGSMDVRTFLREIIPLV